MRLYGTTRIHGIPADVAEANDIITNLLKKREQDTFNTGMHAWQVVANSAVQDIAKTPLNVK